MGPGKDFLITWVSVLIAGPNNIMAGFRKEFGSTTPYTCVQEQPQGLGLDGQRFDALAAYGTASINEAGLNVFRLKPSIALEDGLRGVTGRQHTQYVFNGETMAPNNRLTAKDFGVHDDAL